MTSPTLDLRRSIQIDWTNAVFLAVAHLTALLGLVYLWAIQFSWWTIGLGFLWFVLSGLAVTGGYHRLFSHKAYKASAPLRFFYLFFGAAAVQNSALKWAADHRRHHVHVDSEGDPYDISKGFWWAHIGWVLCVNDAEKLNNVKDLAADPLVRLQNRFYILFLVLSMVALPAALGLLWGDPLGAVLIAGFVRLVFQWHATFCVNSMAHMVGGQPYSTGTSARDSFWTSLITFGEGYHNFHHCFQIDYRCGIRWHHIDPTKWFIWTLSKCGMAHGLRRTSPERVRLALEAHAASRSAASRSAGTS